MVTVLLIQVVYSDFSMMRVGIHVFSFQMKKGVMAFFAKGKSHDFSFFRAIRLSSLVLPSSGVLLESIACYG